jgi:hypothetical protein
MRIDEAWQYRLARQIQLREICRLWGDFPPAPHCGNPPAANHEGISPWLALIHSDDVSVTQDHIALKHASPYSSYRLANGSKVKTSWLPIFVIPSGS